MDSLAAADAETTMLTVDESVSRLRGYIRVLIAAQREVSTSSPDVILANYTGIVALIAVAIGRWFGIPTVVRLGGDPVHDFRERRQAFVRRNRYRLVLKYLVLHAVTLIVFRWATGFVVVSDDLRDRIVQRVRCDATSIIVVPPPIDSQRYANGSAGEWVADDKYHRLVVTVTNLNFRGKFEGVCDLLRIMDRVIQREDNVSYVVAGDGLYREEAVAFADYTLSPASRVHVSFPGYIEDIPALFTAADVFVYASRIDGYPNVVREAQAAGLPVVAAPGYGVAEQIEDGTDGYLVSTDRPGEFSELVQALLRNPDDCAAVGRAAQERVREENDVEVVGERLVTALSTFV